MFAYIHTIKLILNLSCKLKILRILSPLEEDKYKNEGNYEKQQAWNVIKQKM